MSSAPFDNTSIDVITMATLELANLLEPFLGQIVFVGSLSPWFLLSENYIGRPIEEDENAPMVPTGPQVSNDLEITLAVDIQDPTQYTAISEALYGYKEIAPSSGRFFRQQKAKTKMIVDLVPLIEPGSELPTMPKGLNRSETNILFKQSVPISLKGFDFQGKPKSYDLIVARLSTFVLFRAHLFALRKEARHMTDLCYALEFLQKGPIRAADELKPFAQALWVREGIHLLRALFTDIDAEGPIAYAKEHGVSMAAAVKFRKTQALDLVKRLLRRFDGGVDDF